VSDDQHLELVTTYEPVLLFSKDGKGRAENFYPMAVEHFVQECGLYQRGQGWLQPPDTARLDYLKALKDSEQCFLACVAGEANGTQVLMQVFDQGYEPELVYDGDEVMLRLTVGLDDAPKVEGLFSGLGAERRPVDMDTLGNWLGAIDDQDLQAELETGWGLSVPITRLQRDLASLKVYPRMEDALRRTLGLEHVYLSGLRGVGASLHDMAINEYRVYKRLNPVYYYHVNTSQSTGLLILQYWFLYPYNDWGWHGGLNDHEGDWEMIAVLLKDRDHPAWVVYSQHLSKDRKHWTELKDAATVEDLRESKGPVRWQESHPVVYVGCGSHASYFHRRSYPHALFWKDHAKGNDRIVGPGTGQPWGEPINIKDVLWNTQFGGRWGAPFKRHL